LLWQDMELTKHIKFNL